MIVLSIPYASKNILENQNTISKFEFVEFRLDYEERLGHIDLDCFHSKTIVTVRDYAEGGINSYSREEQLNLYRYVTQSTEAIIDDEILHYTKNIADLPSERLILSWHAVNHEDAYTNLPDIIALSNRLPSKFLKIAISVDSYGQLQLLQKEIGNSNKPVLIAGLGKLGKLARLLYSHIGAIGTYAGIAGLETAPGQLTSDECDIYYLKEMNQKYWIGGIIGGEQVWRSRGLTYYNEVLYAHGNQAGYIPFPVTDWDDFWVWFTETCDFINFYGFSITMPWKKQIASKLEASSNIINTFLPLKYAKHDEPWSFNTDISAFQNALKFLHSDKDSPTLVYGTGAMAEMVLSCMSDFTQVYIYGRNLKRLKSISDVYHVSHLSKSALKATKWSLLINCTSLGLHGESVLKELGDISYGSAIDLPYSQKETTLVVDSKAKGIPVVSGFMFWEWQADEQKELFLKELEENKANQ